MSAIYHESFERKARVRSAVTGVLNAAGALLVLGIAGAIAVRRVEVLYRLDAAFLAFFVADVAVRFAMARGRASGRPFRWYDSIVLLAVVQALGGGKAAWACFLARQALALVAVFGRTRRVPRLVSQLWLHPARLMVGSFAGTIAAGTLLLTLPAASTSGKSIGAVDSLFTATSALCVTGLTVKDTGADFTLFGQLVILTLIQLGGLGIMTFSVSMALTLGRTLSKTQAVIMQDMLDEASVHEALILIQFITFSTLVIEGLGAVALFLDFGAHSGYTVRTLYASVFHAISAFCNAGFSLFSRKIHGFENLAGYRRDVVANLVITSLIILGGLGFPVLRDLLIGGRRRRVGEGRPPRLRTHTKVVLTTSAVLIVLGTASFFILERRGTLADLAPGEQLLASYFQSVTARTAGFNTVDIAQVGPAALMVLMCLMYIGASPGSTGGGIKTTTAAILWQAMRSAFRRRPEVEMFRRTVPRIVIRRSTALVTLSMLLLVTAITALASVEHQALEKLMFEAVSAFGTVGLSAGATPGLTVAGRLIITVLMFIGRIGPLTLAFSLVGEARPVDYSYPEARLMVG